MAEPGRERSRLGRVFDALYLAAGILAAGFLVAILALMLGLSIGRMVGINIPSGDDFVSWCMAAMAFLGLAHTLKSGEMIRVGLVVDKLSGWPKRVIEFVCLVIAVAATSYFAYFATKMTYESYLFKDLSQGVVPVPLWIPQLGYCSGLILLAIAFLDELIRVILGKRPSYDKDPPATAEELVERAASSAV